MSESGPGVECAGCGTVVAASEPLPFSCPDAGGDDDVDHLLSFSPHLDGVELAEAGDKNPFIRYRQLLWVWQAARARGMPDDDYIDLVNDLDARIARLESHGFLVTPYAHSAALDTHYKDETGNVAGSHKARHLFGIAIHLAVIERCDAAPWTSPPVLAIASCGNAALAAAVVARAAARPLKVFIPTWANPAIVAKLAELGAETIECQRRDDDPPGDPCFHRFRAAVAAGAVPFSCQGSENGLAIDGGRTLGFELVAQHRASRQPPLSHLFIQVGGGALASSTWQALELCRAIGAIGAFPALVVVQTDGCHPLVRAWDRLAAQSGDLGAVVARARGRRSHYMWPWESEPSSIATGILDDETYDWWQVARGIATTGGEAMLASEADIELARERVRDAGIAACSTGVAGYAGLLAARRRGELTRANPAVLLTGAQR